ncbi:MAG: hypothetical protein J0I41_03155 [Filimonas sp.]|nr:hypothetical protein [Filimonas sp.]
MNYEYQQTPFSKAVMTGLFAGITATVACLAYGFIYRFNTGFTMSAIINVPSIIIACHILLVITGMLYFVFRKSFKGGGIAFILLLLAVFAFCIWKEEYIVRSPIHELTVQFHGLLLGMTIIIGASAVILIPVLSGSRKFEEAIL